MYVEKMDISNLKPFKFIERIFLKKWKQGYIKKETVHNNFKGNFYAHTILIYFWKLKQTNNASYK